MAYDNENNRRTESETKINQDLNKENKAPVIKKVIGAMSPNPIKSIYNIFSLPTSFTKYFISGTKDFLKTYKLPKTNGKFKINYRINYLDFIKTAWYIILWPGIFFLFSFSFNKGYNKSFLWYIDVFFAISPVLAVIITPLILNHIYDKNKRLERDKNLPVIINNKNEP